MWFTSKRPIAPQPVGIVRAYCRMGIGVKVFRMKVEARERLRAKAKNVLARLSKVSPREIDQWNENPTEKASRKWFGQSARVLYPNWVQRPIPDFTETVNGVTYGVYTVKPREWLYSLFGPDWKEIYNAPYNEEFRSEYESKSRDAQIRWVVNNRTE